MHENKNLWTSIIQVNKGSSRKTEITFFYYISFGHIGTDIVESINPFINAFIGYDLIGHRTRFRYSYKTNIVEPISPFLNGFFGFGHIGTDILEPMCPFLMI
jgi:hypothetical protein